MKSSKKLTPKSTCVKNLRIHLPFFAEVRHPYCDIYHPSPHDLPQPRNFLVPMAFWYVFSITTPWALRHESISLELDKPSICKTILHTIWGKRSKGRHFVDFALLCNIKFLQNWWVLSIKKLTHFRPMFFTLPTKNIRIFSYGIEKQYWCEID